MSQKSKDQYVGKMRLRYRSRGRKGKSKLFGELVEVGGLSRKHAINLMNPPVGSPVVRTETRCRMSVCGGAERQALKVIWLAAIPPFGKLLEPMIEIWMPHYERQHGRGGNVLRNRLKTISARSIDRLLAPVKASEKCKRNSGRKPGTVIKSQIPIRI